ncbi:MAG: glycoside hydrolase family 65 protein [Limisphaerales bacterium]
MLAREIQKLPSYIYPSDEWRLVEKRYYPRLLAQTETLFATANGYLGIRGGPEEGAPVRHAGTFLNGFHETWPIVYGEEAFGFARTGQTMIPLPESHLIRLYVDDEPFDLRKANLIHYERALDMRTGTLDREVIWEKYSGKRIRIRSRRLVSLVHRHMASIEYEVELLNASAPLVLCSQLRYVPGGPALANDPRSTRVFGERVLLPEIQGGAESRILLGFITRNSRMRLACGIDHLIETDCPHTARRECREDQGQVQFSVEGRPGHVVRLTKVMTYHSSRTAEADELAARAERALDRNKVHGFGALLQSQRDYVTDFWDKSDVQVAGDAAIQQVIRFNLFHIMQASARAEGFGIPAKGLTGHGYEGQYFWDTEIYVQPFLTYTEPRIVRNLLKFRHNHLEQARQRARAVNQRGALFPWRTINGEEASAYYAAGTAQYHINADIIHALKKYVDVTGDTGFLHREGAEMLIETARLWVDLGFYSEEKGGRFCINGVTGPDEYNTVVNNNAYTNLMARENLWYAASTLGRLREEEPERFAELSHETRLDPAEITEWKQAADRMYVPFDTHRGIHLQDDGFLDKKPWDFAGVPPDKYPLLLHFHPLVIYRHQVIKQADVVLAMVLLGSEFSLEQKRRNFEFYDPLTTGDSSLSVSIQGILAFELGFLKTAAKYLEYAVLMDLADVAANVDQGCHLACMGSTWMGVVYGMAGMRDYNGRISFRPRIGNHVKKLTIPLQVRGQRLRVEIDREGRTVSYLLRKGDGLEIFHHDESLQLREGIPVQRDIALDESDPSGFSPPTDQSAPP